MATSFRVQGPLLTKGVLDTELFSTDGLWCHLKVYAGGGENTLHAHPLEDHAFIVLEGQAVFSDGEGGSFVANRYDGFVIPKGALYCFRNTGEGNLVMLRVGSGSDFHKPGKMDERKDPDGKPTHNRSHVPFANAVLSGEHFGDPELDDAGR
jgi:mannose-6-phosphate isomerase-like protein (cupin superfamily)